jgi:hypothetical protein
VRHSNLRVGRSRQLDRALPNFRLARHPPSESFPEKAFLDRGLRYSSQCPCQMDALVRTIAGAIPSDETGRCGPCDFVIPLMHNLEPRTAISNMATKETAVVSWAAKLRSRDFVEVAVGYGLVMIAIWTPNPLQRYLFWITLTWIVVATVISRQDARTLGLRPAGWWRCAWVAGAAAVAAAVAVWVAWELHTLHPPPLSISAETRVWRYFLWSFLQQFMLQDYFLARLLRLLPSKTEAVLTATVLFASAHVPNPLLVVVTLFWSAAACALFLRYRDLYSLAIVHGILGICVAITVPNAVHHQMRVGLGYLRYRSPSQPVHRSQMNQMVSTEAWVIAEATSRCSSRHALP